MRTINLAPLVAILALTVGSCGPGAEIQQPFLAPIERQNDNFFYVPSTPNTRFDKEKNDFSFNVDHSSGSRYNGLEIQAGFVPAKHLGIIAGYNSARNKGGGDKFMTYHQFELGAGYIAKLPDRLHFENYMGWGSGVIDNSHYSGRSSLKSNRYFIQPGLAYTSVNNTFSVGIASRFSAMKFSQHENTFDPEREPTTAARLDALLSKGTHVLWEPGLRMNAGWKNFKFNAGYTLSKDLSTSKVEFPSGNITVGATVQLNTSKKQ